MSVAPLARRSRAASGTCSGNFRARLVFAALSVCSVALEPFANNVLATCRPNLSDRGSTKLRAAVAALCPREPAWPPRRRRRAVCDMTAPSWGLTSPRSTRLFRHLGTRRRMLRANIPPTIVNASPTSRATGCCSRTSGDGRDSAGDVVVQQQYQRTSVRPSRLTARREGTKRYV